MSDPTPSQPLLVDFYEQYLLDQDAAALIRSVSRRYTNSTLERLAEWGSRLGRRGAVLALGYLGDYSSNAVLGRALTDRDRGVRTLAEKGIRKIWRRVGSPGEREQLERVIRLNAARRYDDAHRRCTALIHAAPWLAEAWNQRALAAFNQGRYEAAIRDCQQALEINPYHFPAATGMGKCFLKLTDRASALESFRRALRLHPGLDDVRAQVVYLQRLLREEETE